MMLLHISALGNQFHLTAAKGITKAKLQWHDHVHQWLVPSYVASLHSYLYNRKRPAVLTDSDLFQDSDSGMICCHCCLFRLVYPTFRLVHTLN